MDDAPATPRGRRRAVFAAFAAAIVTTVFAFVGDGVDSRGEGWRAWVIDHAHTVTWALLTGMFVLIAWGRAPKWVTNAVGWTALASYLLFLGTLATTPG